MVTEPQSVSEQTPGIDAVRRIVENRFPNLWPAVDLGLSTCATLLLAENANPTAVIYVGGASAGKTTVATLFEGARVRRTPAAPPDLLCHRSDKFTPASFVSQAANRTSADLASVDLLPKIRDRVLLTPELAPIFRGDDDQLTATFATVTRVLDGQGLVTDSGTHGSRGYRDDCLFAWIGCTTPLPEKAWRIMGQLGSRLFFLLLDTSSPTTVEDLLRISDGASYTAKRAEAAGAVQTFLAALFERHGGVRAVRWAETSPDPNVALWLARCASLLAAMRTVPIEERNENGARGYRRGDQEAPYRALAVLTNVARGHALVHERNAVTMDDIPLIVQVTVSSMPTDPGRLLRGLISSEGGSLTVAEVQALLLARHPETARDRMRYADALGVMAYVEDGPGKAAQLQFGSGWEWCGLPEFRRLLARGGESVTGSGVCDQSVPITRSEVCLTPTTQELVEHPKGESVSEVYTPHTPHGMTGSRQVAA